MKIKELVAWLKDQDQEAEVVPAAFYGPGLPLRHPYEFEVRNFLVLKDEIWLGFDVYDATPKAAVGYPAAST